MEGEPGSSRALDEHLWLEVARFLGFGDGPWTLSQAVFIHEAIRSGRASFLGLPVGSEWTNTAGQRFRKFGEGDWRMLDEAAGPGIESVVIIGPLLSPQADTPAVVPGQETP